VLAWVAGGVAQAARYPALLSNYGKPPLDRPSPAWLGLHCNVDRVRHSGLWNSNHVDENYDPAFLEEFERLMSTTGGAA
jgi:hypothetical protein